jgi:UDP-N-acetylglucosamine:LPS N-acetylglucosamine transferase
MPPLRVLFTTTSGTGHFLPLVPVVEATRAAGHTVAVAAPEETAGMVTSAGFAHLPFGGMAADDPRRIAVFAQMGEIPEWEIEPLIGRELFGRLNTSVALPGVLAAVERWHPDVIVSEAAECAGGIAAEAASVPWLRVTPSLTSLFRFDDHMASGLVGLREDLGLSGDAAGERFRSTAQIGYFPRAFEYQEQVEASETLRIRDPRARTAELAPDDLVYVTFGTEASGMPFFADMVRASISAATSLDLKVVVGLGRNVDAAPFADLGDHVRLEPWVDQAAVIPRSRVVICHAGAGTTLGALSVGVPILAVPLFADQPLIAARVAATDCGVVEAPGPDLDSRLAAAVDRLVAQPPAGSAAMRANVAQLADVSAAVDLIERHHIRA